MKAKSHDLIPFPLLLLKCHKNEIADAKLFFLEGGFFFVYNSTVTPYHIFRFIYIVAECITEDIGPNSLTKKGQKRDKKEKRF